MGHRAALFSADILKQTAELDCIIQKVWSVKWHTLKLNISHG
jgi:hypothetical protein